MFANKAPKQLLPFLMVLNSHSDNNYIVGGAARDLMSNKVPYDYDIVTDIPMEQLVVLFKEGGFKVKRTGVAHFVLNVYLGSYEVEISNFRKDVVCNGRQAECEVGTIKDDAFRRDFTINAVYMNTKTGALVDPTGLGIDDILRRKLRFVGRPKERIREDYLRVFRFYRFINKGFEPEKKSLNACRKMFNEAYANTTAERVRNEIEKTVL
jgi:poly(A) polymerase